MTTEPMAELPAARTPLYGIGLKVASTVAFTMMSAGVRWLSVRYPVGELVFVRCLFALIPVALWLWLSGLGLREVRPANIGGHLKRGVISTVGMTCGFIGLSMLPLTDAVAIGYVTPLLVVILAAVVLKETVRAYRWGAVVIGLIGVGLMLSPHMGSGMIAAGLAAGPALGATAALFGAFCSAAATIEVRQLTRSETTASIVTIFMVFVSALSFFTILFGWNMPSATDALVMVTVGILGGLGQIFLTESYRHADTSVIAPFEYSTMLWAVMIGFLLFGETPSRIVVIGAAIVIMAGLFVLWRERRLGLDRAEAQRAAAPQRTV